MSSWLLWTACRVVALAYSACAVRDAALTLIVSLDVCRYALRCWRCSCACMDPALAALAARGPGRPLWARWRCWRRRHCCWDAVSLRPACRPARPRTQTGVTGVRRGLLAATTRAEPRAAALTRRRRTAALEGASPGVRLPGAARRARRRLASRTALPSRPRRSCWSGAANSARWPGAACCRCRAASPAGA